MNESIRRALLQVRSLPFFPALLSRAKHALIDGMLSFFGSSFEVVSAFVPEFREEIAGWEDGRRFAVGVLPRGPFITLEKRGEGIRYLGKGLHSPSITMSFKNYDAALPVFLGIHGSFQAFAYNGILVHGDLSKTMEVNRAANIVNAYLFPGLMLPRFLKRVPEFTSRHRIAKAQVYLCLVPNMLRHLL
ncbi:MAG TPA: hypothetical protein PLR71_12880 [Deltaproteobacteria bacterium]|nr:hypothetical protein [Deltaproteobacteria bacterium]HQI82436.1 hypothetical protein [Deltaproteobacteria bacterium]